MEKTMTTKAILVPNIVETNGKTIRENNLEKNHHFNINDKVKIDKENIDSWLTPEEHGEGIVEHVLNDGDFYIVDKPRDCDGEPLYSVSIFPRPNTKERTFDYYLKYFAENLLKQPISIENYSQASDYANSLVIMHLSGDSFIKS